MTTIEEYRAHFQWRPISEIHEEFGPCVVINLRDPGDLAIGSNIDTDWDDKRWTHFARIPPLDHDHAAALLAEMDARMEPCNDCGEDVPAGDLLCSSCRNVEIEKEEWDKLHPEAYCPPRE